MLLFTHDKNRLLEHFRRDPILFAYHLGDLDEFFFEDCQWAISLHKSTRVDEAILVYHGGEVPTVLAFGLSPRFEALLDEALELLPPQFYGHFFSEYRSTLQQIYDENRLGAFQKMRLNSYRPVHTIADNKNIRRLAPADAAELQDFFRKAYPDNYFIERMLATGKYFAYAMENKIVSVAGVHVYSKKHQVAALGNIATLPDYRGQALATRVTSYLVNELLVENCLVVLNVKRDNEAAIKCYRRLGFEKTHEYEESLFRMRK